MPQTPIPGNCRADLLECLNLFRRPLAEASMSAPTQPPLIPNSRPLAPHNRLGLDYQIPPVHKVTVPGGIIDAHNHVGKPELTRVMVDAAKAYGVTEFWTMT